MIYASVVKINVEDEEDNYPGLPFPLEKMEEPINLDKAYNARRPLAHFSLVKTSKFSSISKAYSGAYDILEKLNPLRFGVLLHERPIGIEEALDILTKSLNGGVQRTFIQNPLRSNTKQKRRRVAQGDVSHSLEVTPALKSQLYALINDEKADKTLINLFSLKDTQKDKLYQWENETFPKGITTMNTDQAMKLIKNVLNRAKLPWIKVNFQETGKQCSFSLKLRKGGKGITSDSEAGSSEGLSFVRQNPNNYDNLGDIHAPKEYISISNMSFNFAMDWGLNPYVILHELAHYIQFCMPSRYMLNQGQVPLSYTSYQTLFAGHGAAFAGVFARLLIDFAYINEEDVHRTLSKYEVQFVDTKEITLASMDKAIERFIENKQ